MFGALKAGWQALKKTAQKVADYVQQKAAQVATAGTALVAAGASHAQATGGFAVDVSPITDGIDTVFTAVGTIGPAIVLVWLAIKAYKWIRAALS